MALSKKRNGYFLPIGLWLVILFTMVSCQDEVVEPKDPVVSTFYLIRHAEKDRTNPENRDPELNQEGLGRALKWGEVFEPVALDAIYSTNYERTTMTAAPVSVKKDIDVKFYDPNTLNIEEFLQTNAGKNVLIVGHSNTTPEMTNRLLGTQEYTDMDDSDNSSLFIVRVIDGKATAMRINVH